VHKVTSFSYCLCSALPPDLLTVSVQLVLIFETGQLCPTD